MRVKIKKDRFFKISCIKLFVFICIVYISSIGENKMVFATSVDNTNGTSSIYYANKTNETINGNNANDTSNVTNNESKIFLSPYIGMDINKNLPKENQAQQRDVKIDLFNHYIDLLGEVQRQKIVTTEDNKIQVRREKENYGWKHEPVNDKWYFMNPNGECVKGWHKEGDNKWYFFDFFNNEMHTGYRIVNGKVYYFEEKSNGKVPKGQLVMNDITPFGNFANEKGEVLDFPIPDDLKY